MVDGSAGQSYGWATRMHHGPHRMAQSASGARGGYEGGGGDGGGGEGGGLGGGGLGGGEGGGGLGGGGEGGGGNLRHTSPSKFGFELSITKPVLLQIVNQVLPDL